MSGTATRTATATTRSRAVAGTPRRRRRDRWLPVRIVAAVVVAGVTLFPLYWMLVVALSTRSELLGGTLRLWPRSLTLANFARIFAQFPILTWFGNSVAISVTVAVITVTCNLLAGYAFAVLRFRGSTAVLLVLLATLTLPLQVIMVALFRLVTALGIYGSYWAVILPTSASAFGVLLARQFIQAIPRDLVEAARLDGATNRQVFTRIVLPLSKPLIAVLFFMSLLTSWNDFAWPLIALKQNGLFTLPIGLLFLQSQNGPDYGGTMAFALLDVVPIVVVFLVFQRFFVQGFARSGLR